MTREQREQIAQELLVTVADDPELQPGELPYRMTEAQWIVFKTDPRRFRKPMPPTLPCSECGNRYPREELIFESEQVQYCKSCLEIL
jgi:hypothetical protein